MKKIYLSIFFVFSISLLFTQKSEEKDLKALMKELGYSWSETKSVKLREGESAYFWRTFYSGNDYAILAFSENSNVYDLDLHIYDKEGSLIDKSITDAGFEMIEFTQSDTKQVKIVINNYKCSPDQVVYKCKFMIFYK